MIDKVKFVDIINDLMEFNDFVNETNDKAKRLYDYLKENNK